MVVKQVFTSVYTQTAKQKQQKFKKTTQKSQTPSGTFSRQANRSHTAISSSQQWILIVPFHITVDASPDRTSRHKHSLQLWKNPALSLHRKTIHPRGEKQWVWSHEKETRQFEKSRTRCKVPDCLRPAAEAALTLPLVKNFLLLIILLWRLGLLLLTADYLSAQILASRTTIPR